MSMPMILGPGPFQLHQGLKLNLALPLFFFKSFCVGLLPDIYFGTKPSLLTSVEKYWFILCVYKICCKIFLFQTGEKSVRRKKCNKVFTLPSLSSSNECWANSQLYIHQNMSKNFFCNQLDNDMQIDIERLILKYIKCRLFYYVKRKFYLQM